MSDDIFDDFPDKNLFDLADSVFCDEEDIEVNIILEVQDVGIDGRSRIVIVDLDDGDETIFPMLN